MDPDFMYQAQLVRAIVDKPFVVVRGGGFRCKAYDEKVGTSDRPGSGPHSYGKALDIIADSTLAALVTTACIKFAPKITRFGFSSLSMHIDGCGIEEGKPTRRIWTFSQQLVMP